MTADSLLWMIGQSIALIILAVGAHIKLLERINDSNARIIKLEVLLELFGRNAAKILHRDDDKYGVDSLLERYVSNHNELSMQEWEELRDKMDSICKDQKAPKSERTLAAWLSALAVHKLGMYGKWK